MLVVSSENSGCDLILLVSRNYCRDLNSMSRPHSLCLYCISMSRPRFDVATYFLLRRHSIVLSFQAGRDSKLLVCLFSCRDVEFRSRASIFFNHCNSCRDLKNYVATILSSYLVATSSLRLNSSLKFFLVLVVT